MSAARLVVFLPCHTLDDFPSWLEDAEADELLAAWVAAWSPELIAGVGGVPSWASVDLAPPRDGAVLGIVPACFDDRFAAQHDAIAPDASRFVRGVSGCDAVHAAALEAMRGLGIQAEAGASGSWTDDFRALGLGVLLGELLARRMRSAADLETTGLVAAAVTAASAAVEGRHDEVRERLEECFRCLEAARARYYPVDAWLVDLVLLAGSTLGPALRAELSVPTACGVVATGGLVRRLAAEEPESLAMLRTACADGRVSACGGREDDRPLDACLPEEIRASFESGTSAWREHVGVSPRTFAQVSGGCSAILPQLLQGLGYDGALLGLFDGTPLPAGAAGRIRWEGGGGCIDALARPPLDARRASTILSLPNTLGDAMDHDHTAVVVFARHAGTASPWHALLRRLGGWGGGLGTFVAPDDFFRRTAGAGTLAAFAADAFSPSLPPDERFVAAGDPVAAAIAAARGAAIVAAADQARILPLLEGSATGQASPPRATGIAENARDSVARRASHAAAARRRGWFGFGLRSADSELILDNGRIRAQVNRKTGGLLSVRGPGDAANRLSQRLAVRGTRPAPAVGRPWESMEERAEYSDMLADAIARVKTATGDDCVESRGRLTAADGSEQGTFVQRVGLAPDAAVAILDIEVALAGPATGPLLEHHAACRFAWHENDDVEIRRGVHAQAVETERSRFTAPHFVTVEAPGQRGAGRRGVAILTGGLPWHVRSGPHMLDTILVAAGGAARRRLAIGIDVVPWHMALALLVDGGFAAAPARAGTARIAVGRIAMEHGRIIAVSISLIESEGRPCEASIRWNAPVTRATASLPGGTRPATATVAVEDRETVVSLQPYEWLDVTVEFER